jgi:DNA-binding HxlR family transcriptional regulator
MNELEVFGTHCLEVLSNEVTLAILLCLRARAMTPTEMAEASQRLGYRIVLARLQALLRLELVLLLDSPRQRGVSGHRRGGLHGLSASGLAILDVVNVAAECEQAWPRRPTSFGPPGAVALGVVADHPFQAIARALASKPLRASELERLLPEISHGTLLQRLHDYAELGLFTREEQGRAIWYSLTDAARRLATVTLHAALWELLYGERERDRLAGDLAGFVYQVAPLVRLPTAVSGSCVLHDDWHTVLQRDIYLGAGAGQLAVHFVPPVGPIDSDAHASPQQWSRAIIEGNPSGIYTAGDRGLLEATICGLHGTL